MRHLKLFRPLGVDCALADQGMPLHHPEIIVIRQIPDDITDAEVVRRAQKTVLTDDERRQFLFGCHRALQNQPLMGASEPATPCGWFQGSIRQFLMVIDSALCSLFLADFVRVFSPAEP